MALIQAVQDAFALFTAGQHRVAIILSVLLFILANLVFYWGFYRLKRHHGQRGKSIRRFAVLYTASMILLCFAAYILCGAIGYLPENWPILF